MVKPRGFLTAKLASTENTKHYSLLWKVSIANLIFSPQWIRESYFQLCEIPLNGTFGVWGVSFVKFSCMLGYAQYLFRNGLCTHTILIIIVFNNCHPNVKGNPKYKKILRLKDYYTTSIPFKEGLWSCFFIATHYMY